MSHHEAAVYRRRAAHLRALAERLRTTPSMTLHLHAGVDTWHGPRADECTTDLARAQQGMHHAADDLETQALRLHTHADELAMIASRADRDDGLDRT